MLQGYDGLMEAGGEPLKQHNGSNSGKKHEVLNFVACG